MKFKSIIFLLALLLIYTAFMFGITDPKFKGLLTYSPMSPKAGQPVTFSVLFKVGKGDVQNLEIIGGIDGKTIFNKFWGSLPISSEFPVNFNWTAQGGTHTAFFQIDPTGKTGDINLSNNKIQITFNVSGTSPPPPPPPPPTGNKPNLVILNASYSPKTFKTGDPLTFSFTAQNNGTGGSSACEIHYNVNGKVIEVSPLPALSPGGSKIITTPLPGECNADIVIIADGGNSVSESNEGDNSAKLKSVCNTIITPGPVKVQKPNFVIKKMKFSPTSITKKTTVQFSFKVLNNGDSPSFPTIVSASVNTFIVKNWPLPKMNPGQELSFSFATQVPCKGKLAVVVDGNFNNDEHNENDNGWEHFFGCSPTLQILDIGQPKGFNQPQIPKGLQLEKVRPNFILTDVKIEPYNFKLGDHVKLRFRVKNAGDGHSEGPPAVTMKLDGMPLWDDKAGYKGYAPGETSNVITVPINTYCGPPLKVEIQIDKFNHIPESNETDNQWQKKLGNPCTNLSIPWIIAKVDNSITYPMYDERKQGPGVCGHYVYYRVYNKSKTASPATEVSIYLNGKFIQKDKINSIPPGKDWLMHANGFAKAGSYIWVIVDEANKIKETDEADNTSMTIMQCK